MNVSDNHLALFNLPKIMPWVATLLAILQIFGGVAGELAVYISLIIAAIIGLSANPRYLSTLLILILPAAGFRNPGEDLIDSAIQFRQNQYGDTSWFMIPLTSLVSSVYIGFMDFWAPFAVAALGFVRVVHTFLVSDNRSLLCRIVPSWIISLWLLAFIPALYGAYLARTIGYSGSALGVRMLFTVGAFFWGVILAHNWKNNADTLVKQTNLYILVIAVLYLGGLIANHLIFIFVGLGAGVLPILLKQKKFLYVLIIGMASVIIGYTQTFTTLLTFITSLALAVPPFLIHRKSITLVIKSIFYLITIMLVAFFCIAIIFRSDFNMALPTGEFFERFYMKLFLDRGNVWGGAFDFIINPPYFIVPPGRPYFIYDSWLRREIEWPIGAHNTILESIRQLGWLSGTVVIVIMLYTITAVKKVWNVNKSQYLGAYAAGFLGIALVQGITGHFLNYDQEGFIFWAFGGLIVGMSSKILRN